LKRIFSTLSEKWPEYFLEVLVITMGILGAFILNNWRDNALERQSELESLASLKQDLIDAGERINAIKEEEQIFIDKLISFLRKPVVDDFNSSELLYEIIWAGDETTQSIDTYVEIDEFDKINFKNKGIRKGVATIENRIQDLKISKGDRLSVQQQRIDPYLINDISLVSLLNAKDSSLLLHETGSFDLNKVLNRPDFRNAIALKMSITTSIISNYNGLQNDIQQLVAIIDNEIAIE
jgi:hypothetical protein